jgi:hypothetical protein
MCVRVFQDDRLLSIEEENNIFQSMYKNIIGCKSSKLHVMDTWQNIQHKDNLWKHKSKNMPMLRLQPTKKNIQLESKVQQLEE